jgi:hypothetical protein
MVLKEWDHTSTIHAALHNLSVIVLNITGRSKVKPRTAAYFHPYRDTPLEGMKVTAKNIGVLKLLAAALSKH